MTLLNLLPLVIPVSAVILCRIFSATCLIPGEVFPCWQCAKHLCQMVISQMVYKLLIEILWKFYLLLFLFQQSNHVMILHISCSVCNSVTWSNKFFKRNINFHKIWVIRIYDLLNIHLQPKHISFNLWVRCFMWIKKYMPFKIWHKISYLYTNIYDLYTRLKC